MGWQWADLLSWLCLVAVLPCRSPLHAAAYSEKVDGLRLVLDQGAEVNAVDGSGRSALMVAADRGQSTAVGKTIWTLSGVELNLSAALRAVSVLRKCNL